MKAFKNFHPVSLAVYFLSVLTVLMFTKNPVLQAEALVGAALFLGALQGVGALLSDAPFYLALFAMTALTNPLFSHNGVTPLFFMNGNPVTLEALLYGVSLAATVIGALILCRCFCDVMTSDKILYLAMAASPKFSLVLSMALRFIPMLVKRFHRVERAQRAMGLYSGKSVSDRVKFRVRVFLSMIPWTLENAMETSASMRARGYGKYIKRAGNIKNGKNVKNVKCEKKKRTNFSLFKFTSRDAALIFVCLLSFGISLLGEAFFSVGFEYYPRLGALRLTAWSAAVYAVFGAVTFMPFLIEVKEALVWKYCVSKI